MPFASRRAVTSVEASGPARWTATPILASVLPPKATPRMRIIMQREQQEVQHDRCAVRAACAAGWRPRCRGGFTVRPPSGAGRSRSRPLSAAKASRAPTAGSTIRDPATAREFREPRMNQACGVIRMTWLSAADLAQGRTPRRAGRG